MRVLLVTPSYFPIIGGSEVLTRILSTKLNEQCVEADIMTFNMREKWRPAWRGETAKDDSIRVFREGAFNLFPRLPNPMSNLFQANLIPNPSFLKKLKDYDILHFVGEADLSIPLFSCFIDRPKILQCVGIFRRGGRYKYYTSDRAFLGHTFIKVFPRIADHFLISSPEEKELVIGLGVPDGKIVLLPLGVDTTLFRPDFGQKSENMILFVGRIDQIKGLHTLLQALEYISMPLKLVAIGPAWDPDYVRQIEDISNKINSFGFHSVCLMGALDSEALVQWYQKASILVCPYEYETHSNVVREALACGTPVVSTGSHLAENGQDGIVTVRNNPRELARAIGSLLNQPKMRERLGNEGRRTIEQSFSWDSVIKGLIRIYKDSLLLSQ